MKKKKRVTPPGIKVYFPDAESQELYNRILEDSAKYKVSASKLIYYALEFGLGYVEGSFEDMKNKKP